MAPPLNATERVAAAGASGVAEHCTLQRYAYRVACAELLRDAGTDLDLAAQVWRRRHPTGRPPIGLVNPQ
jgi:hypothetical protein